MTELKHLLFVFSGLLAINATLAGVLWARQRTPLHRALFLVWASAIASGVAQAVVQSPRWMVFAFGICAFVVNAMLVDLVRRALDLGAAWRLYAWSFAAGLAGTAVATLYRAPFWAAALPIAVG